MIIQLFVFALIFIFIGILFLVRKKKIIAWMFFLLAVMLSVVAGVVIALYPNTWPF